ncbi:unnamed protein product [Camellia sinensis]
MHFLTSFSSTRPHIIASLSKNNPPPPPPPPPHTNPKPPLHRINTPNPSTTAAKHLQLKQKQQKQKQPSVAEIEKVIGAGVFRDRDTSNRNSEQGKTLFDSIFSNSVGESEGPVERKLRETGEWIIDRTERSSNSIAGEKYFDGRLPIRSTNLDFVISSSFWDRKASIQYPFS